MDRFSVYQDIQLAGGPVAQVNNVVEFGGAGFLKVRRIPFPSLARRGAALRVWWLAMRISCRVWSGCAPFAAGCCRARTALSLA